MTWRIASGCSVRSLLDMGNPYQHPPEVSIVRTDTCSAPALKLDGAKGETISGQVVLVPGDYGETDAREREHRTTARSAPDQRPSHAFVTRPPTRSLALREL